MSPSGQASVTSDEFSGAGPAAPSSGGRTPADPVVAFMSPDAEVVRVARSILQSAGVPYWSRPGGPRSGLTDELATSILVAPADIADAKALLAALQRSEDDSARRLAQGIPDPAGPQEERATGLWYAAPALAKLYWWGVLLVAVVVVVWEFWHFAAHRL